MAEVLLQPNGHLPGLATPGISSGDFKFGSADDVINRRRLGDAPQNKQFRLAATAAPHPPPTEADVIEQAELGVLKNFKGTFAGHGYNMIFRPFDGNTQFPNPISSDAAQPADNVLELNLTKETIVFSDPLGVVPNRGLTGVSKDISLNGVPYVQTVSQINDLSTGGVIPDNVKRGDPKFRDVQGIHFEPGLWMFVPGKDNTTAGASLSRMASIPHGTAINAQCPAPGAPVSGAPTIPAVDIRPFLIGQSGNRFDQNTFKNLDINNKSTRRIPQDLTKFQSQGTITAGILSDPNTVLRNANKDIKIVDSTIFEVSTKPKAPELGGGIANIDFLEGAAGGQPNADAIDISARFWVETVEWTLPTPKFPPGAHDPIRVTPPKHDAQSTAELPTFVVSPHKGPQGAIPPTFTARSTQIQYSQLVNLNFAGLTWPHVSVATLRPAADIQVQL